MGVSIHYRGHCSPDRIQELYQDLIALATTSGWKNQDFTSQADTDVVAIVLYPHKECDPIYFLFDSEGRLHPPRVENGENPESSWCFVKTQYAPIETHVAVVDLLRYILNRYMPGLEVIDEGGYWETGDIEALQAARDFLAEKMDSISDALSEIQANANEHNAEVIADLVEEAVKKRLEFEKRKLN